MAKDFAGICALRTLLGVFEAVCQPAFLILVSFFSFLFFLGHGFREVYSGATTDSKDRVPCGTREKNRRWSSVSGTV